MLPPLFPAERFTVKVPALEKVCDTFAKLAVVVLNHVVSPKLQFHVVGVFVDVSLNWIASGAGPEVMLAVKLATGADDPDAADTFTHVT